MRFSFRSGLRPTKPFPSERVHPSTDRQSYTIHGTFARVSLRRPMDDRVRVCRYGRVREMKDVVSERSTVVAVRQQVSSDLGGEIAILDLDGGMYYGLDEVGARIWELVQEPRVVEDVQGLILEEYEVKPEIARRDVLALLQELADRNLVVVRDEPSA
jgi:hypothetical protein